MLLSYVNWMRRRHPDRGEMGYGEDNAIRTIYMRVSRQYMIRVNMSMNLFVNNLSINGSYALAVLKIQ